MLIFARKMISFKETDKFLGNYTIIIYIHIYIYIYTFNIHQKTTHSDRSSGSSNCVLAGRRPGASAPPTGLGWSGRRCWYSCYCHCMLLYDCITYIHILYILNASYRFCPRIFKLVVLNMLIFADMYIESHENNL